MTQTLDTRGTIATEERDPMTTKEQIVAIRKATGLSQMKFAKRFGIPSRTVEAWEKGERECPTYVAELLAYAAQTDYHTPRLTEEEH